MKLAVDGKLPAGLTRIAPTLAQFIRAQENKGRNILKEWGLELERAYKTEDDHRQSAMKLAKRGKLPPHLTCIDLALYTFIRTQEKNGRDILKEWGLEQEKTFRTEDDQRQVAKKLAKRGILPPRLDVLDYALYKFIYKQERAGRDILKEWGLQRADMSKAS